MNQNRNNIGILLIYSLVVFFIGNQLLPITDPVESNYVETAKEMILTGNYFSPVIYGNYWYDKPILFYLELIAAFQWFGFTDFAARFFPAVFSTIGLFFDVWIWSLSGRSTAGAGCRVDSWHFAGILVYRSCGDYGYDFVCDGIWYADRVLPRMEQEQARVLLSGVCCRCSCRFDQRPDRAVPAGTDHFAVFAGAAQFEIFAELAYFAGVPAVCRIVCGLVLSDVSDAWHGFC